MVDPDEIIKKFLPLLNKLDTREDFFKIQYDLLSTLYEVEKAISIVADKPESILNNLGIVSESEVEKRDKLSEFRDNAEFSKEIILTFGDSLAWILLDREFIRGSINSKKGGNVTFRSGFEAEVEFLNSMEKKKDTLAIFCDLTHCLGISDVISIRPDEICLNEVKSSSYTHNDYVINEDKRLKKQTQKMDWFVKYSSVKEGELPIPKDVEENFEEYNKILHTKRIVTDIEDRHYFKELDEVILRAKNERSKYAYVVLDNMGLLEAYYGKDYNKFCVGNSLLTTGLAQKGDRLIFGCLNRHIFDFPDILPIPLFGISQSSLYELLSENVLVFVTYPIKKLIQLFSTRGVKATWEEGVLSLSKKGVDHNVQVLPYQINRMLYELLTPESLVNIISVAIDNLD